LRHNPVELTALKDAPWSSNVVRDTDFTICWLDVSYASRLKSVIGIV